MHQLPRGSRKSLLPAPAASDQLGQVGSGGKTQSSDVTDELEAGRERASSVEDPGTDAKSPRGRIMAGHSSEAMSKLNQIIQVRCSSLPYPNPRTGPFVFRHGHVG